MKPYFTLHIHSLVVKCLKKISRETERELNDFFLFQFHCLQMFFYFIFFCLSFSVFFFRFVAGVKLTAMFEQAVKPLSTILYITD